MKVLISSIISGDSSSLLPPLIEEHVIRKAMLRQDRWMVCVGYTLLGQREKAIFSTMVLMGL
jgi:hypothetical protein